MFARESSIVAPERAIPYAQRRVDRYWRLSQQSERAMKIRPGEKRIRDLIAYYAHRCAVCGAERCEDHQKSYVITRQLPYGFTKMGDCVIHNEDLVQNIRIIFDCFVAAHGSSSETIRELRRLGVGAPRGRDWYRSSLMTIILDTAYSGDRKGFSAIVPGPVGRLARRLAKQDHRRRRRRPHRVRDAVGRWASAGKG